MSDAFSPKPEHKFTFGLWTVGNPGRDPFGEPVRPVLSPVQIVHLLAEVGAYGVNFHDNDLVPIDATPAERDQIVKDFKKALADTGLVVPMATTNLFGDPAFKDGAFTSNDPHVRAYALQKTMHAIDLGVELGAKVYVFWGGREGVESDATKSALEAIKRFREAINFLSEYVKDKKYDLVFALEAKPNEPRHDIYLPTTGHFLGFIETLDHPEMVGVNPEVAHEHMSGLNFMHARGPGLGRGQALPHRPQRPGLRPLRPGPPLRLALGQELLLPGQVPRGRGVPGQAPLRLARLPHRGPRGRQGLRPRLHAQLPDLQGEGAPVERGQGDPGPGARDLERADGRAARRSAPTARRPPTRSRATRSTARRSGHAASATSSSTSSRSKSCSACGRAKLRSRVMPSGDSRNDGRCETWPVILRHFRPCRRRRI